MISRRRATLTDVTFFLRQFATLLQAGIPLITCLTLLTKGQPKLVMNQLASHIKNKLLTGEPLHQVMQHYPLYFNGFTCKMVQIGEQTGQLTATLMTVVDYHEKKIALIKKIQQTLFYPVLLLISASCITLGLFLFVVPHFAALFADTQTPLPLLTLCLFTFALWLKQACLPVGVLLFIIIAITVYYLHQRQKPLWDELKQLTYRLPLLRHFWQQILIAQFVRNLALGLRAGMPITDALILTTHHTHPNDMRASIAKLRRAVTTGLPLHHGMMMSGYFPTLVVQMVKIGEESGMLEEMLEKTADCFELTLNERLRFLTTLIEPLIMLIVGSLIGGLVIGMYLPIFKLGSALS